MDDPGDVSKQHPYHRLTDHQLLEIITVEGGRAERLSTNDPERAMRKQRKAIADAILYLRMRARVVARSSEPTTGRDMG
jgi:hypothetical protein